MHRNESLDALRGLAIVLMILSGSIAYGNVLPAWMFHAQVPPPDHIFNPSIPGITWVDLVFPFFLFSMGAAIPLSLQKHFENNTPPLKILTIAFRRFFLLVFFAFFTNHMKAWAINDPPGIKEHLLSILAFVLLFFQFYKNTHPKYKEVFQIIRITSFLIAFFLLAKLPFWNGKGFNLYKSDIIILVLANMSFFGLLIYYFTWQKPLLRIGLLPFIMAVFLAAKEPADGWAKALFNFNHIGKIQFDWLYKFYFLKYLFIIIPGTIAGEIMLHSTNNTLRQTEKYTPKFNTGIMIVILSITLLIFNVYALFTRMLFVNLMVSSVLCTATTYFTKMKDMNKVYYPFVKAGTYLLLLGLFFEAYEGGIKKDTSTYSYYFVTSGLAFFTLLSFLILEKKHHFTYVLNFFSTVGKNPLVAYVTGNLLLLPLLSITHLKQYWDNMNQNFFMGFMKGVVFTTAVALLTIFFVKRNWFWKT